MLTPPFFLSAFRRLRRAPLTLVFAVLPLHAQLQSSSAGAATSSAGSFSSGTLYRIAGTVVNAASGEPIRHAAVAVLSEEDSQTLAAVESDSEGRFSIARLPAGKYQLTASRRGFRTAFYDEHGDFNSAVVTGPGQETGTLKLRLVPGAELHGTVTADGGDPVEGAKVMLFMKPHAVMTSEHTAQQDVAMTDDTGAYEFDNLAAGDYMIAVSAEPWYAHHRSTNRSRDNRSGAAGGDAGAALDVAYPITFFDSTTEEAAATPITLAGSGREEANINLHAVPALHIVVNTPRRQNGGIARAELRQTVFGTVVSAVSAGFMDAMETGATEFDGVAPGHYELAQGDPPRVVDMDVSSSRQVDPELGTPTVSISGSVHSASGAPLPDQLALSLESLDASHSQNPLETPRVRDAFSFPSVAAGTWALWVENGGKRLPVVSITAAGRTHLGNILIVKDRPMSLVVNLGTEGTRLEGFARRSGRGVSGVMVVLVPKDMSAYRGLVRRDQSDSDGSFSLRNAVPGHYTLVAIEDGWEIDWADPAVIGRYLPGGIAVTVSDAAAKIISLDEPVPVQSR